MARIIEREDNPRNHAMLRFLYETGCLMSKLRGITWRDVHPRDGGLAQVTASDKGDKTRHVLISKRLYRELARLRGAVSEDAPLFPSKTGRPELNRRYRPIGSGVPLRLTRWTTDFLSAL